MGRFLFVGLDTGGTWKPMLGLAAQLVARGHVVAVLGSPLMRATTEEAGCSLVPLPVEFDDPPDTALEDDGFRSWVGRVCGWAVAEAVGPAADLVDAQVLVVDFLQFNALSAGELLRQPVVSVVHFGMTDWGEGEGWEDEVELLNSTRARLGLDALPREGGMGVLWGRPDLALSLLPPQWTPSPVPPNVVTVGPIPAAHRTGSDCLPWPVDDPRPLVLISMSSTYMHQEQLLGAVATAVAAEPVRVLLSLGGAVSAAQVVRPESVVVRGWLDLHEVLPHVELLVTHGGMATASAALAHGVPMLVLPQSRDQNLNAQRVVESGAGLALAVESGGEQIQDAVRSILDDDSFRQAAIRLGEPLRALGAGRVAVEHLERLLPSCE